MNITTVLGARPQFIKAAPVSRVLRAVHSERLLHTGQHYDPLMSAVFFDELDIPAPDVTLHVGSASHGAQTGRMLEAIEQDLMAHRPDAVLVYGDTNSTLAGALAAAKLGIPLVHVEAGLRSFVRDMPEEINRIVTDRLSTLCCCPSASARDQLAREGITAGVEVVGDVMLDALRDTLARVAEHPHRLSALGITSGDYILATVHRAANTDDPERLNAILAAFGALGRRVLWPMHPRTRHTLETRGVSVPPHVRVVEPLGYLDLVVALQHAKVAVTDSGGLQKEAYWLGIPCVTLRHETEWTETVASGWNVLADADMHRIVHAVEQARAPSSARDAYGDIGAAQRVVDAISRLR
ncbi:MAG: UDP-N-acetylglucosamine 2-epimerase (non-hydrolyzing) [Gemmatimonadaceae bacterium]|nr:UDP-N-acetylglucosamine 2-epimerase (non-hydrolyzing) [Gemmatimonadaceae bacterium]